MNGSTKTKTSEAAAAPSGPDDGDEAGRIDMALLRRMDRRGLAELCRLNGLPEDGTCDDLRGRLRGKALGGDRRHVHGGTLCTVCGHVAAVSHTETGLYRRIHCPRCGRREKVGWSS